MGEGCVGKMTEEDQVAGALDPLAHHFHCFSICGFRLRFHWKKGLQCSNMQESLCLLTQGQLSV